MSQDWLYLDAKTLLARLKKGEITSRALVDACYAQIDARNPLINAVIAQDRDAARRRADEADAATARGESWGPLHGLPMTLKDTYEVPGLPCTAGSSSLKSHMPKKAATAVQSLLDAGAIVLGKTNVPLFASDIQSYNKLHGTTHNPWNVDRTPGGSSGGAAAALAAGFTPLELGSDIGGSIRTPAHFCGVYGHKSTQGIVPLRGHIPGPPGTTADPDLAVAGPMARSADDLQLMLDVVAGPSPSQQPGWQLKLPAPKQKKLADFRVLLWIDDPLCPIDHDMTALYLEMKQRLEATGVSVTVGAPLGMTLDTFYPLYLNQLGSVIALGQPKAARMAMNLAAPVVTKLGKYVGFAERFEHFMSGAGQSFADWKVAHERSCRLTEKFQRVFADYDVILMPPAATTALPHQQKPEMVQRKITVNGVKRNYTDMFMWIAPATLMGLPATSAPLGQTPEGLPVNVQIMGDRFQDRTTIKFAGLLAGVMGGFVKPKGY
ncbi:MAG: amidase [Fluviicoccus sp.]|uniref:amidase n=1 Tax=Fluviicoccus sp. TaxID=2003552 RepID=UPI00271A825A|nr:amidase [Fluviicoccus sp.]MDO8330633.1 amidase [Fluviicoccus sp.]